MTLLFGKYDQNLRLQVKIVYFSRIFFLISIEILILTHK